MIQTPGLQATTQETSRVLTRGKLEFFAFEFFYDQGKTQPVLPFDPQTYPSYQIFDPSGQMLVPNGLAVPGPVPGTWKAGWVVPSSAELSNVHRRYRLQVVMVDAEMRQFETSYEFDVVEAAIPAQLPELQQFLTFANQPLRLVFRNTVRPDLLSVKVTPKGADSAIRFAASFTPNSPTSPIQEIAEGNGFAYVVDLPGLPQGSYSALWNVRDYPTSAPDFEHQVIQVIVPTIMHLVNSVRMVLDKLQKKLGIVYAYSNEDLLEYVRQGLNVVNGAWPPTSYSVTTFPSPLETYIVTAAIWWGLQAQLTLYAETNLNFSGQTVTLEYNPGADLENRANAMREFLDNQLKSSKKNIVRSSYGAGSIATRPYRFRTNLVFPISRGLGSDLLNQLTVLGLLD